MADFVFATWEGGGHVTPALWAARRLADRGHAVRIVSDEATRPEAEGFGLPFTPWRTAPDRPDKSPANEPIRDWEASDPADLLNRLCERLMCGPAAAYAADLAAVIDETPGAVVVSHELLLGAMVAAEAKGAPLALLTSNVWPLPTLDAVPPFGPGLAPPADEMERQVHGLIRQAIHAAYDAHLPPLNAARTDLRLPPLAHTLEQIDAARLILVSAAEAFDFAPLPAPYVHAGPQARVPAWAAPWESPWAADDPRPLVLVSFSTLYQAQEPVLRRVIAALATLPVRGLVTLGPQLAVADFSAPDNVAVVESASHDAVMPHVAAMITHAGHGSAIRPILHGVPLLCLPMGRDQADNAARITTRGAGLRLEPDANVEDVASAVARLLAEPGFAKAAAALGARIRLEAQDRGDVVVDRLEALALGDRPERSR